MTIFYSAKVTTLKITNVQQPWMFKIKPQYSSFLSLYSSILFLPIKISFGVCIIEVVQVEDKNDNDLIFCNS